MSTSEQPEFNSDILNHLSSLTRVGALLTGATYISGLLITNIFLAQHGFFLFQLLKADYMLVGGFWILLLGLAFVWTGAVVEQIREKGRPKLTRVATSLLWVAAYLFLMMLISVFTVDETTGLSERVLFYTCGIFLGQAISLHLIIWVIQKWLASPERRGQFTLLSLGSLILVTIFLSSYYRYATDVYSLFPRILGGGRPAQAQLLIDPEFWDRAPRLGLILDSDGLSGSVQILYETSDAYFVLPNQDSRGIKLGSDHVKAVLYVRTGGFNWEKVIGRGTESSRPTNQTPAVSP